MTVTLAQAIRVLSNGKYSVGLDGTISSEDATVLETLLAPEVERLDPGFSADELVRFKAYLMLDALSNSSGNGSIVEKTVKDVRWKIKSPKSSSQWMEYAEKMLSGHSKSYSPSGVARCDAYVTGLDSTAITQYGEPAYSEEPQE